MTETKPYGTWSSPLTPGSMAGDLSLREVGWAGQGETVVWAESRDGRGVLVARRYDDAQWDVTRELDVRGGVGYGGGEFGTHGDTIYFAESSGRLYAVDVDDGTPEPITPEFGGVAAPTPSPEGDWVLFVHTDGDDDVLGVVEADGDNWPQQVVTGADFYMQPTWHPSGDRIAWVEWDHPNMPWTETRVCVADVEWSPYGPVVEQKEIVAGEDDVSAMQPQFSPDGSAVAFTSDRDGWWHVYCRDLETGETRQLTDGECEMAGPAWVQGIRSYEWMPDGERIAAVRNDRGWMELTMVGLDGDTQTVGAVDEYAGVRQPAVSETGRIAFVGSSPSTPPRVVTWAPGEEERVERRASAERVPEDELADLETISWQVDSDDGEWEVFGNYYPPTNPAFESGGEPPAILMVHGGPTSQRTAEFEGRSQFFATRGFAVLDVNYRGSTGFGRDYRDALLGNWGVADVEDVVAAADHLVEAERADPEKLVVMGGSAGGYTVLQSLVTHPGVFAAGVSMYGISNLFTLSMDTHKFEENYNDSLVGSLPEAADEFRARSPIFHAEAIEDPVALFQGGEDQVVPKEQADAIAASLEKRGVPHAYEVYEHEGHGWSNPETVEDFYERTLDFLREHVLFG